MMCDNIYIPAWIFNRWISIAKKWIIRWTKSREEINHSLLNLSTRRPVAVNNRPRSVTRWLINFARLLRESLKMQWYKLKDRRCNDRSRGPIPPATSRRYLLFFYLRRLNGYPPRDIAPFNFNSRNVHYETIKSRSWNTRCRMLENVALRLFVRGYVGTRIDLNRNVIPAAKR